MYYYSKKNYFNTLENKEIIKLNKSNIPNLPSLINDSSIKNFYYCTNKINDTINALSNITNNHNVFIETNDITIIPFLVNLKFKVIYNMYILLNHEYLNKLKLHGIKLNVDDSPLVIADYLENINESIVVYKLPKKTEVNNILKNRLSYQSFNKSILNEVKRQIIKHIKRNDYVIDATVGNGNDTLFLAKMVPKGKVIGFDIQEEAIQYTKYLTKNYQNVTLYLKSHTFMNKIPLDKKVSLILFNLGYLPGADKSITTTSKNTLKAITNGLSILKKDGIILVVIYPGHEEGKKEKNAILRWLKHSNYQYEIKRNTSNPIAPFLICIHNN